MRKHDSNGLWVGLPGTAGSILDNYLKGQRYYKKSQNGGAQSSVLPQAVQQVSLCTALLKTGRKCESCKNSSVHQSDTEATENT